METASISELKAALKNQSQPQLIELCLRLARFKKDNKELLTFLLFEAGDLPAYTAGVQTTLDDVFAAINTGNLHWIKKSLRKALRLLNKYAGYTGSKTAEVELRLHFCALVKKHRLPVLKSASLAALYNGQLKKIDTVLAGMHEDLQRDYQLQLALLKP